MSEGAFYLIRNSDEWRRYLNGFIEHCQLLLKDGPIFIKVERYVHPRTLSQNQLMWALFDDIAKYLNEKTKPQVPFDKEDIHDRLLVERFGQEKRQIGQIEVVSVPKTRGWDAAIMSDFISWIIAWALDRRIPIKIPACEEYEKYREANA